MIKKKVKIVGERNSGTNLLEQLIVSNFDVDLLKFSPSKFQLFLLKNVKYDVVQDLIHSAHQKKDLGWKHGIPLVKNIDRFKQNQLAITSISKNPYAFLLSLYRRPYHFKGTLAPTFSEFIKQPWISRRRDNCPTRTLSSPVELWNCKNAGYQRLSAQLATTFFKLKYEDLLLFPEQTLDQIKHHFQLIPLNDTYTLIESSTKGDRQNFADYAAYYGNENWKQNLTHDDVEEINQRLNHQLLAELGYELLSPTDFRPQIFQSH